MKRKLLTILLSIACIFSLAFGLTACIEIDLSGNQSGNGQGEQNPGSGDKEKEEEKGKEENKPGNSGDTGSGDGGNESGGGNEGDGGNEGGEGNEDDETENAVVLDGIKYVLNAEGDAYICAGLASADVTDAVIASAVENLPVTTIGAEAFITEQITSVQIPESVTTIKSNAFERCTKLKSVTVPDSVTYIGHAAFAGCTGLESVVLSNNLTSDERALFYDCSSLESITLSLERVKFYIIFSDWFIDYTPVSLKTVVITGGTYINYSEFKGLTGLKNVTIPNSITSISSYAFSGCTSLESITIPDSVTTIGEGAFSDCTSLESLIIPDSVTRIDDDVLKNCISLNSLTVPFTGYDFGAIFGADDYRENSSFVPQSLKTVVVTGGTSIYSNTFYGFDSLTSVTLWDGVTRIGEKAFYGCSSLESFEIPKEVETIEEYAFTGCGKLEILTVANGNRKYYSENNCVIERQNKTLILGCKGSTIPADGSVTAIGDRAFYGCTGLESIVIPSTVTEIGSSVFSGCTGLESITVPFTGNGGYYTNFSYLFGGYGDASGMPRSLKTVVLTGGSEIVSRAFYGCSYIENITYPTNITEIASYAFYGCSSLKSITIPASVSVIGYYAFYNCSSLKSLYIPGGVTDISNAAFAGCTGLTSITVAEDNAVYHSAGNCIIDTARRTLHTACKVSVIPEDNSVVNIRAGAFEGQSGIESIIIPDNITSIGSGAFYDCTGLKNVTIPDSVTEINSAAFYNCSSLQSIVIPESVELMDHSIFGGCSSLESLTIPFIGNYKRSGEELSWSYPIGYLFGTERYTGGIETQQSYWGNFEFDVFTETYYIPSSLKNVTVTGGNIWYGAFCNCQNIENVVISGDAIRVTSYAFSNCKNLQNITLPDGLKYIDESVFSYCSKLASITIPESVIAIGELTFYRCTSLTSVTLMNCEEWHVQFGVEVPGTELSNPQTAATYFTDIYYNQTWQRYFWIV